MEKIKHFIESEKGKDILTIGIVILVGLGSFGLGRMSKGNYMASIKANPASQTVNAISGAKMPENSLNKVNTVTINSPKIESKQNGLKSGNFLASKSGHKYYPINCSAGKAIKQENKIYFNTADDAVKAGYTLSSSCL